MRYLAFFALAVLLISGSVFAENQKKVLTGSPGAVQVMLPGGKVTVSYVEAAEGMMVYVECQGVTVKARTVFVGDGQVAVPFEATNEGFFTPEGKRNVAAVTIEPKSAIKSSKEKRQVWASKPGAVYVLIPDITFAEEN